MHLISRCRGGLFGGMIHSPPLTPPNTHTHCHTPSSPGGVTHQTHTCAILRTHTERVGTFFENMSVSGFKKNKNKIAEVITGCRVRRRVGGGVARRQRLSEIKCRVYAFFVPADHIKERRDEAGGGQEEIKRRRSGKKEEDPLAGSTSQV